MIKQLSIFLLGVGFASHTLAQDYSCHLGETLTTTTAFNVGPNVYAAAVNDANVEPAIIAARDAWDATDAIDRIGSWTTNVSSSDCPYNQPFQLGYFNFQTTSCYTNNLHGIDAYTTLAFVDWPFSACGSLCGTLSLTVNSAFAIAANGSPMSGEYDLRALVTHEFGHVLGLHHQQDGSCDAGYGACLVDSTRDTMSAAQLPGPGEGCQATLESGDISTANYFYP